MHLQIGAVLSMWVLVAACKGDSLSRSVTYDNDEAIPNCDSLDDKASERARRQALKLFENEPGLPAGQWKLSRGSRCDDRILVRILVVDGGAVVQPFFVRMDEDFSHREVLRPE